MKFDLQERLINYSVLVLKIADSLPQDKGAKHLANQQQTRWEGSSHSKTFNLKLSSACLVLYLCGRVSVLCRTPNVQCPMWKCLVQLITDTGHWKLDWTFPILHKFRERMQPFSF